LAGPPRFYNPGSLAGDTVELDVQESRHASAARRLKPESAVEIFDGEGGVRQGVVVKTVERRVNKKRVSRTVVRFTSPFRADPPPEQTLTIALSPPKGERMIFVVEKLSELQCDAVLPVVFTRSIDAGVRPGTARIGKWRRIAVESAKQCGRNRIMEVADPIPFPLALESLDRFQSRIYLDCHEACPSLGERLEERPERRGKIKNTVIAVGPEGGFTRQEQRAMKESGMEPAGLWDNVLRIETAAITAAALFRNRVSPRA